MKIIETPLEGLFVLETKNFQDTRGGFQKLFNYDFFKMNGLETGFKELYYSVNNKGVIRGKHFQTPPHDNVKVVYVSCGRILDAVVDIRKDSPTYRMHFKIELNAEDGKYLYIPKGFAHGFASLEDNSIVNYAQTTCYAPDNDYGIMSDSCGIDWPFKNPIVSGRDLTFETLVNFNSPF